jgi:hypothetical protein
LQASKASSVMLLSAVKTSVEMTFGFFPLVAYAWLLDVVLAAKEYLMKED